MTKQEFLEELRRRLSGLSGEDLARSLDFYSEMIDDRMEDGMTEAEAVANVGNVDYVAAQIREEYGLPPEGAPTTKAEKKSRLRNPWAVGFTSPLWIVLWILGIACAIVLWSIVVVFYAVSVALGVSGVVLHIAATPLFWQGRPGEGLVCWGAGVFLIGFTVLWNFGCHWLCVGVVKLCKILFRGLRAIILRKGDSE